MDNFKIKYGYFDKSGKEYVITKPDTPRPWVNVICPNEYGAVFSQAGSGFSWYIHARMNRVTKWQQDLLRDANGKYIFIRDMEDNELWSASWMPVKKEYDEYKCIHGIGYTKFINKTKGIRSELLVFVPPEDKVEIWKIKLKNESEKKRNLKITSYMEWCLGVDSSVEHRELHDLFIETAVNADKNILAEKRVWSIAKKDSQFFNHPWEYTAYHCGSPEPSEYLCDRRKFIGNYRDLSDPAMEGYRKFPEKETIDKWDEPIGSLAWDVELAPGEEKEIEMLMGIEEERDSVGEIKQKYLKNTDKYFKDTVDYWDELLGKTHVQTPDEGFNIMVNYWLKYQAVSARLVGRTGYYQTGGAFGFRDQLQDSQVYFKIKPEKARERILIHASRQFQDGAVQHWWHPITDSGLRNNISDNLLWLPFIAYRYLMETGDYDVLNEEVSYLDKGKDTLKVHCEKAIERVFGRRSKRGITIIGEGDWNDGLSAVGHDEKGESIWLSHFLVNIMKKWSELEEYLGDKKKAKIYSKNAQELTGIINDHGWDGNWYIRATTDRGTVLGSASSDSGKIFLNAQTWAIMGGIAPEERIPLIQKSLEDNIYREYGPILFYPAYTKADPEIGYVTRYAPGTRENGGLYFHAACWAVAAECEMKRPEKVKYLLDSFLPPKRSLDPELYCCEPYVLPGNVDGPDSPYFGKGGWTWYTGSAAWLYTIGWDWIIGLMPVIEGIKISPCLPAGWDKIKGYRYCKDKKINFEIFCENKDNIEIKVNGEAISGNILNFKDYVNEKELNIVVKY
ncbi:GH36-type glycosyl hydrolase domain-containing protein [Elusimicrobiota bacterium]